MSDRKNTVAEGPAPGLLRPVPTGRMDDVEREKQSGLRAVRNNASVAVAEDQRSGYLVGSGRFQAVGPVGGRLVAKRFVSFRVPAATTAAVFLAIATINCERIFLQLQINAAQPSMDLAACGMMIRDTRFMSRKHFVCSGIISVPIT